MMLREATNISYSSADAHDPYRQFDIYYTAPATAASRAKPLLCFVHGGAWRAYVTPQHLTVQNLTIASEDKADHAVLARNLAQFTRCPVAVPNYRLTPRDPKPDEHIFQHPRHAEDILEFLAFVLSWPGPSDVGRVYDPRRLFPIGHSCSAHMLSAIFLDSSSESPSLAPSQHLLEAVQAVIMSEGIFDLPLLLSSFPQYADWFIRNTFGQRDDYAPFSTAHLPLRSTNIRWHIIHSRGDTLVDVLQSQTMYDRLCALFGSLSSSRVSKNLDQLDGDHNDILNREEYVRVVGSYVMDHI